jgi:UDP-N-acetylmuramyl pentapeptide phosphotransferase/UDP-N-acetylglucosamine-1-phosphate transferase
MILIDAVLILAAFAATLSGVGAWREIALRRNHLDVPNERSSHTAPTPRGGGAVIFLVLFAGLTTGAAIDGEFIFIAPFLFGAAIISVISFLDDLFSLPNWLRFAIHAAAALQTIWAYGYFNSFLPAAVNFPFFGQLVTILWIVGLTNAYNFMDGIDGIAGTQGFVAGAGWALIGFFVNQPLIMLIGGLLAAACLGFLRHNWHPARIFMGDVGSALLGYSFAVLPLLAHKRAQGSWAIVGFLLVWTFVFDTVLTFCRRALRGENIFAAHRSHLYQRLVIAGWRHDAVTLVYGFLAVFGASLAGLLLATSNRAFLFPAAAAAGVLWMFVRQIEIKKGQK